MFFIIFIIQIFAYIILDKYNLSKWKYLVFSIILIFNFFVLPSYFIPDNDKNQARCGMPALGITLAFWIFGNGSAYAHILFM
jgi:hypothetical protein